MRRFALRLEDALGKLGVAADGTTGGGGGDADQPGSGVGSGGDAASAATAQLKSSDQQPQPGQPPRPGSGQPPATGQPQTPEQGQQLQQTRQSEQLGTQITDLDKQINTIQAKITGGATKPTDINQLNQLLTARQKLQTQYMRLNGVKNA